MLKTKVYEDVSTFACAIADIYDNLPDEFDDIAVIGTHEEIKELLKELICIGYDIGGIDITLPSDNDYHDEYVLSIGHEDLIWVDKMKVNGKYITIDPTVAFVSNECNSKVLPYVKGKLNFAFEISCDCEDCGGCNYCGTVGYKETPAETVKNDVSLASTYRVNGKKVSKDEYEKAEKEFLKGYSELRDEFNKKLATLDEVDRLIHNAFRFGI